MRAIDEPDFGAIAHEVKTPLAMIVGYAELLGVREDEQTRKEAVAGIQEAIGRLAPAVEWLLLGLSLGSQEADLDSAEILEQLVSILGDQMDAHPARPTTIRVPDPDSLTRYVVERIATRLRVAVHEDGPADLLVTLPS